MNIRNFGKLKCSDIKKIHRYFKEWRMKNQPIDVVKIVLFEAKLRGAV